LPNDGISTHPAALECSLTVPHVVQHGFHVISNDISGYIPKRSENTCPRENSRVFIAALLIIIKR
jgi:hypothetical protein